jgi:hypothetical protein
MPDIRGLFWWRPRRRKNRRNFSANNSGYWTCLAQRPDVSKFCSVFRLGLEVELDEPLERATPSRASESCLVRCQKSSHEGQEAINRSTRFMRSLGGLQRTPFIPLNPSNEMP